MATIKDIAREAGVSVTTVSNVIQGKYNRVSKSTIEKVNQIIHRLNYVPNMGAKILAKSESKIVGIVINILTYRASGHLYTPFVSEILGAIETELQRSGYYTMLYASDQSKEIEKLIHSWNVQGMITIGLSSDICRRIGDMVKIPTVYTDCYFKENEPYINVGTMDEEGMYLATKYLIDKGHRRIGYVADMNFDTDEYGGVGGHRFQGYKKAMAQAGLSIHPETIFYVKRQERNKGNNFEQIYQNRDKMSAIAFCYDYFAMETLAYLRERGVRVPEDLSMISFDDIDMARLTYPRLTTIHQGIKEKGIFAAKQLIELLEGRSVAIKDSKLPVHLVERESVLPYQAE